MDERYWTTTGHIGAYPAARMTLLSVVSYDIAAMLILMRTAWKDWGLEQAHFQQAESYREHAVRENDQVIIVRLVRAGTIFYMMSFEAYYFDLVRGYIQNTHSIPAKRLSKVQDGLNKRKGIFTAVTEWPRLLTGKSFDKAAAEYQNFLKMNEYRNCLVHGKIAQRLETWGKLAQEVETLETLTIARDTASGISKLAAKHFGYESPTWL